MIRSLCVCLGLAALLGCRSECPTDANKAVVRNYMEQIVNQGKSGMCEVYFSPNLRFNEVEMSPRDLTRMVERMRAPFVGLHLIIEDQFAAGDVVVTRVSFEGTDKAERPVRFMGIAIDRLEAGRVVEMWHVTDPPL